MCPVRIAAAPDMFGSADCGEGTPEVCASSRHGEKGQSDLWSGFGADGKATLLTHLQGRFGVSPQACFTRSSLSPAGENSAMCDLRLLPEAGAIDRPARQGSCFSADKNARRQFQKLGCCPLAELYFIRSSQLLNCRLGLIGPIEHETAMLLGWYVFLRNVAQ